MQAYCVGATSWIPALDLSWKPLLLAFPPLEKMQTIIPSSVLDWVMRSGYS